MMEDRAKKNMAELTHCSVAEYRELEKRPLVVMTDNVRSMHNIGAIFRTADAFRVHSLILGGISGCPPHPEISKSALGAEESVEWRHVDDCVAEAERLRAEGWSLCVLEQAHNSVALPSFRPAPGERYLLVVGNEVHGVDQRIVDMADHLLEIPQEGTKHSLNVSTSASIAIYQIAIAL